MAYTPPSRPDLGRDVSFIEFAPRRAMASFENLVALANYEERLREARKIVWRDRGERPAEVHDLWECLEHACRGGLRAGGLAFAIRSGVNFLLLMTRIRRLPKTMRFALIRHALFGPDSLRFASMLGSFVAIYKFILNALPILLPDPVPRRRTSHSRSRSLLRAILRNNPEKGQASPLDDAEDDDEAFRQEMEARGRTRRARLSMSAQAHQMWVRKRTRRWYSVVAGTIAGAIAISCEKRERRVGIAQQMFVRGLQGSWNAFSSRRGIKVPHGDILLFSLCCGQIMYAWLFRQDTLPRSYNSWILLASKVHKESCQVLHDLVRHGTLNPQDLRTLASLPTTTPTNRTEILERLRGAVSPTPDYGPRFPPCSVIHPWLDSCSYTQVERFFAVFWWMFPIYGALHLVPALLFRRRRVLQDPVGMLTRVGWGTTRSSAFLGVFVVIFQGVLCFKHNVYNALTALRTRSDIARAHPLAAFIASRLPQGALEVLLTRWSYWVLGFMTGLSLFAEEKHRREELAMYVLPKALESAWVMARGRGLVWRTGEVGEVAFTAAAMGMVMTIYQNEPEYLSGLVRRILYQFVGPN